MATIKNIPEKYLAFALLFLIANNQRTTQKYIKLTNAGPIFYKIARIILKNFIIDPKKTKIARIIS